MEPQELRLLNGAKLYKLVFDNAAAFAFEEEYRRRFRREKGIFQLFAECVQMLGDLTASGPSASQNVRGPSLTEIVLGLWALANTHHVQGRTVGALTVEKLQGEIDATRYGTYVGLFAGVVSAALPEPEKAEKAKAGGDESPLAAT